MISKQQFRDAMVIVDTYCHQVVEIKTGVGAWRIGSIVELSDWGKEMQGNKKRIGKVVDFLEGYSKESGSVCVKWEKIKKPEWMHISQVKIIQPPAEVNDRLTSPIK